ncbi:hypothetical protein BJ944DRAFT_245235, partial [Cunninghamella echinulata]
MYIFGLVILISLIQLTLAAQFKVIAPGGKQVQVLVNGKTVDLKAPDADVPYFVGNADATGSNYKYVVDGKEESFMRQLGGDSTMNDFYNRPVTYADIPRLPNVIGSNNWDRAAGPGPIWDTNYIPSVFINGNPKEMKSLIQDLSNKIYSVKFTIIDANDVHTFD